MNSDVVVPSQDSKMEDGFRINPRSELSIGNGLDSIYVVRAENSTRTISNANDE